jgi:hypothetical protein
MRPRSSDFLIAGLALLGGAVAWSLFLVVGWSVLSVFGLAALAVAHRLEPKAPRPAPERAGAAAVIETYAIQLANRRRIDGLYSPRRLAHTVRAFGFALLAVGVYMLVRQQV